MGKSWIAPVIIGLVGAAILVWLGTWQVQRLAWKAGVLAQIDAKLTDTATSVPQAPDPARDRYLPVVMQGKAGAQELHVLVSHKQLGAGFKVITAFEQDDGRRVLLDQGFVPVDAKTDRRMPTSGAITGNLHWPDDRNSSTPTNDAANNMWFARDLGDMAAALNTDPVLVVLRNASQLDASVTPLALDSAAIPNDHLSYAITWYSLAVIWLGMTAFWLWRIRRRTI